MSTTTTEPEYVPAEYEEHLQALLDSSNSYMRKAGFHDFWALDKAAQAALREKHDMRHQCITSPYKKHLASVHAGAKAYVQAITQFAKQYPNYNPTKYDVHYSHHTIVNDTRAAIFTTLLYALKST